MVVQGNTFKLFVGNLSDRTTNEELRALFEEHGTVVEADVMKNYGFVHMQNEKEGNAAIDALNSYELNGKAMVVEASKGYSKGPARKTKIFIGNIHKDTKVEELRSLFAEYGEVVESDILNHYGFIHMSNELEAAEAIRNLHGFELHGLPLRVKESVSKVRQVAGMGNPDQCYRCGSSGHWSKECPRGRGQRGGERNGRGGGDRSYRGGGYRDRRFERDRDMEGRGWGGGRDDRYERMERRGYGSSNRYDPYPPPPSRDRYRSPPRSDRFYEDSSPSENRFWPSSPLPIQMSSGDPYERRPPPPPLPPAIGDYFRYGRRSPPRYPGGPPPPSYDGYRESLHRY